MICLFDLIFYVPVNNFSVMSGRVFLGWNSTKHGLMCLAQGHNAVMPVSADDKKHTRLPRKLRGKLTPGQRSPCSFLLTLSQVPVICKINLYRWYGKWSKISNTFLVQFSKNVGYQGLNLPNACQNSKQGRFRSAASSEEEAV